MSNTETEGKNDILNHIEHNGTVTNFPGEYASQHCKGRLPQDVCYAPVLQPVEKELSSFSVMIPRPAMVARVSVWAEAPLDELVPRP